MESDPFTDLPERERHWGDNLSTLHSISSRNRCIASVDDPLEEPSPPNSQNIRNKKTTQNPLSIHPSKKEDLGLQLKYQLTIYGGWRKINDFCSTGNLPSHVASKAIGVLEVLSEAKDEWFCPDGTVGKLQEILIACCIYIACRQYDIPQTFKGIRVLTGTSKSEYKEAIGQAFKFLQDFISVTKCSCLKTFRIPPEGCCQVCHEIYKGSSPDANYESLEPCIKCSGLYHMSCAMRTSAAINTPNPGDLVCRRCVPCTIHPHIEQGPSSSTEKALGVAPDNAHAEARKGTKGTGTDSSPNKSYITFETTQCNVRPDTMKSPAVKQLKKPRQKLENKPAKSDEVWSAALNDSFPQAIEPHTPEPSEQRRPDDIRSRQRREIPQQRRTDLWVRRNQSNPYQTRCGSWIRKIEERRQFPHRSTATPQPRRPESWPDSSEEEESPCGRRTLPPRRTNSWSHSREKKRDVNESQRH